MNMYEELAKRIKGLAPTPLDLEFIKEEYRCYQALERFDLECYARGISFSDRIDFILGDIDFNKDSK